LLVAVSGGADSVALLRLLVELNRSNYWHWQLTVAHVDHGIRGRASAQDAAFVRDLAKKLGLEFMVRRFKLGPASEDRARSARLRALAHMFCEKPRDAVVMAHHADDQAETVLLHLMRGTGMAGLAGMPAAGEIYGLPVVRPLLHVRRTELRQFLKHLGQNWREDATNALPDYLRNRVRAKLLPIVEQMAPSAVAAIGRMATLAQGAAASVERTAAQLLDAARIETRSQPKKPANTVTLRREMLRDADTHLCGEVVRQAVQRAGGSSESADFERVREAVRLIQGSHGKKAVEMGRGIMVILGNSSVSVIRRKNRKTTVRRGIRGAGRGAR
jgi:tRNA(Ile)-lysidine synthase